MLTPCGTGCEDAWLATASLLPLTRRVKFLVAFRPALLSPTLAAQMASTYQRLSDGRLLVNIVTGAEPAELARFGVWEDKETRYERTGEFVRVMRGALERRAVRLRGRALQRRPPRPRGSRRNRSRASTSAVRPMRPNGSRPSTSTCTSRGANRRRWWRSAWSACAALAAAAGRTLDFGIRFHVIARPTADGGVGGRRRAARPHERRRDRGRAGRLRDHAVGRAAAHGRAARRRPTTTSSCTRTCGPASGSCAVASAPRSSAPTKRSPIASRSTTTLGFDEFILSGYPAPRRGVLVRRRRDAGAAGARAAAAARRHRRAGLLVSMRRSCR